jgi:hypothetical protein
MRSALTERKSNMRIHLGNRRYLEMDASRQFAAAKRIARHLQSARRPDRANLALSRVVDVHRHERRESYQGSAYAEPSENH